MALKHHVAFSIPVRTIDDGDVVHHFRRLGYTLVDDAPGEWRFRRGTKLAALWRFDIRAYATDLVVRSTRQPDGSSWVSCDFEVWTFMNLILAADISTLEAEVRELESILRQHTKQDAAAPSQGVTSIEAGMPLRPQERRGTDDMIQGIRAEPGAAADRSR